MEISDLFEILAKYLDFTIDFLLLRPLPEYARRGAVSPELVSFFLAGVLLAYVIAAAKRVPGYERDIPTGRAQDGPSDSEQPVAPEPSKETKEPKGPLTKESPEIPGFVMMSILGGALFHGVLLIYHMLNPTSEIGTVKDTLNAVFAVGAVYNPINALLKQLQRLANAIAPISKGCAVVAGLILLGAGLAYFWSIFYWIYALATVHGTTRTYILPPMLPMIALGIALAIFLIRSQGTPRDTSRSIPAGPSQQLGG